LPPYLPFAIAVGIGSVGWKTAVRTEAEKLCSHVFSACPENSRSQSNLFKPFIATPVPLRFRLSLRRDLELERLMGPHRMSGKMTVVVLAKTKK
jgi:hypothetical protein